MSVITANGFELVSVDLHVPYRGAWWARIDFTDIPEEEITDVEIVIDDLTLKGKIVPERAGTSNERRKALVIAGNAGFGTILEPLHYRADTGVRARLVVDDTIRSAGETLDTFEPENERVGPHYVRQSGTARRVLEDCIGSSIWWVDYDGITHVSPVREQVSANPEDYRVLSYDPLERIITLEIQNPGGVIVGSLLEDGLDVPQTVKELDLSASASGLRMQVWTGDGIYGRVDSQAYIMHKRYADKYLFGSWRYRVDRMNGDKIDARPVLTSNGLPELVAVELSPGIPGFDGDLPDGLEVLIEFVEGNRSLPRVVGFSGHDQANWTPTLTVIDADEIKLGDGASEYVALSNLVESKLGDLYGKITSAVIVPNDGGAAIQNKVKELGVGWPSSGSVAATKVKAE